MNIMFGRLIVVLSLLVGSTVLGSQEVHAQTPRPTPSGVGRLTSGSVPRTGFGLIVFGGGTVAQLVNAAFDGKGCSSPAVYASVGGKFVLYAAAAPSWVNDLSGFTAAFPGGNIPANTAFVGRC